MNDGKEIEAMKRLTLHSLKRFLRAPVRLRIRRSCVGVDKGSGGDSDEGEDRVGGDGADGSGRGGGGGGRVVKMVKMVTVVKVVKVERVINDEG